MTAPAAHDDPGLLQPVAAGIVASLVGFASTFAVVLTGLRAVGATEAQAASGLLAICVTMGLAGVWLGLRTRMPVSVAWSTPGAALLVSAGVPTGGWPAAVGAFLVVGVLIVLAGLWQPLGRWIAAIPGPIASAMLAGVLLPICLEPARAVVDIPWQAGPVVLVWLVLSRVARRWAVVGALVATAIVVVIDPVDGGASRHLLPTIELTAPSFHLAAMFSIALPLFVVTMASQNVPGLTVLASFGYRPPLRPALAATGLATVAGAPFGAHTSNLAAITAALMAGPDAHPDPARRWVASVSGAAFYLVLGPAAGLAVALVAAAPSLLIGTVAGLALLGALAGALQAALADDELREAAVVTFAVSASAISALGISAAFWGLAAGLVVMGVARVRRTRIAG